MNGSIGGLLDYSRDKACISHMRELEEGSSASCQHANKVTKYFL